MSDSLSSRRSAGCLAVLFLTGAMELANAAPSDIVFVSRDLFPPPDPAARASAIETARSGRLLVLTRDDKLRVLVDAASPGADDATPADVMDPDVSFDGARIVFAGYTAAEDAWRIYEIGADGSFPASTVGFWRGSTRTEPISRCGPGSASIAS